MKFEVNAQGMAKALKTVAAVIPSRPVMAATEGILLETEDTGAEGWVIRVTATNTEVEISTSVPAEAVIEEGTALLDGKRLAQAFQSLPNKTAKVEVTSANATIRCGASRFTLAQIAAKFPEKKELGGDTTEAHVHAADLLRLIETVKYAIAQNDTRMALTGMKWELRPDRINAIALDGYRMGVAKTGAECQSEANLVVPAPTASLIASVCKSAPDADAVIRTDGKAICADCAGTHIYSILFSGEYIDYRALIPTEYNTGIRFQRADFQDALHRANVVGNANNLVKLTITDTQVVIEANDESNSFREEVPAMKNGADLRTAYNSRYLADALGAVAGDELQLDLSGATKPGVLKPVGTGKELHIVLPVRIVSGA